MSKRYVDTISETCCLSWKQYNTAKTIDKTDGIIYQWTHFSHSILWTTNSDYMYLSQASSALVIAIFSHKFIFFREKELKYLCVFEKGMEDYVCTRNCLHSTLSWTGFDGNQAQIWSCGIK